MYVTARDAEAFCKWVGEREGIEYRLPTEAEWEYCCRAGAKTIYVSGSSFESLEGSGNFAGQEHAGFVTSYRNQPLLPWEDDHAFTAPVGRFRPNALGLYDMIGNVWEWCADRSMRPYASGAAVDPIGPQRDGWRLLRGGSV